MVSLTTEDLLDLSQGWVPYEVFCKTMYLQISKEDYSKLINLAQFYTSDMNK